MFQSEYVSLPSFKNSKFNIQLLINSQTFVEIILKRDIDKGKRKRIYLIMSITVSVIRIRRTADNLTGHHHVESFLYQLLLSRSIQILICEEALNLG